MFNSSFKTKIQKFREDLHQIPELGYEEFKTQAYLKAKLIEIGFTVETVAKTGLIAIKHGTDKKAIAFRSDIDALAITEKTDVHYKSLHEGKMHACGHDGHMSILLGFALYLSKIELNKTVVLIFQPAEESPGGAKVIVESGVFEKYKIEKIFGMHLYPEINEGKIGLTKAELMAQVGEFDITINAQSAHGAMPEKGVDGILVAASLIQAYQSIISRNLNPIDSAVLTIGKISAGDARNIIAQEVTLNGTMRAFSEAVYQVIKNRIIEINNGLEKMFNVSIQTEFRDMYPALINNYDLYLMMQDILEDSEIIDINPLMIAEDFSFYLKKVPGYFLMLGSRNDEMGYIHPLHSCYFNFTNNVLFKGIEMYIRIAKHLKLF